MYCSIARFIIFLPVWTNKCTSWVQPQIEIYPGFLDIYSASKSFVNSSDLITGQPYTLGIRMANSDQYDYLIQSCTYNNKYHFVDQNSCLVHGKFFLQIWENNKYQLEGATKHTLIHFIPPEPFDRLECGVRLLRCYRCAERACGRKLLPVLVTYPQQMMKLAIINEHAAGIFTTSVVSWPLWIWLLILLGLTLLFCLLLILLLLCSQLVIRKRKVPDSKMAVFRPNPAEIPNILVRAKELEANGASEKSFRRTSVIPASPPPPSLLSARIMYAPSNSSAEIAHPTASRSRIAAIVRQRQPCLSCPESTFQNKMKSRSTSGRHTKMRHLESVTEEYVEVDKYDEAMESKRKFQSTPDNFYLDRLDSETAIHQQTSCEEKFFKKGDHQNGTYEEGYDRTQVTHNTPKRHVFDHEVV